MNGTRPTAMRVAFTAIGGLAGLCFWLLADVLPDRLSDDQMMLAIFSFAAVFFGTLLAMLGPLGRHAVMPALGLGVFAAALLAVASQRHADLGDFLDLRYPALAATLLACLPMPFIIAARRGNWASYPVLFTQSWNIVVRYAAALLFAGLAWLVLLLSDALLDAVGLELIGQLLEHGAFGFIFTGLALGLALAVVHELSDYVSPFLMLRLLRLLLPVVLVVVGIFVLALALQSLESPFAGVSKASVLLAMGLGVTLLVSAALDGRDEDAVQGPVLRFSAQGLALMLPLLAALAAHAVWQRVGEHGWTPPRLLAATAAGALLGYGVLYAVAVVMRVNWMGRIRQANIVMALVLTGVATLWLTPVIHPEDISATSQLARYEEGAPPARLPLRELRDAWGHAGREALAELTVAAGSGGDEPLRAALDRLARIEAARASRDATVAGGDLLSSLPVVPAESAPVAEAIIAAAYPGELRFWLQGCRQATPSGQPGCVLLVADLHPDAEGEEALLFYTERGGFVAQEGFAVAPDGQVTRLRPAALSGPPVRPEALDDLRAGRFSIAPPALNALRLNNGEIILTP